MGAGPGDEARDSVLAHADQAAGGPGAAALAEMLQDVEGLGIRQSALLQDGPLALGEAVLAAAAVEEPALVRAVAGADGEVAGVAFAVPGAIGVEAAEAGQVTVDPVV